MSSSIRPDEFSKYAPRWVREGTSRPRDALSLPPAPQLPKVVSEDPPWRGPSPFDGDVRQWRARQLAAQHTGYEPEVVPDSSLLLGRASMVERLFRIAAVVVFAVIAMGALGLVLFPDAPRDALHGNRAVVAAATQAPAPATSQRDKYAPIVKSTSRVGVPDPQPAEPARVASAAPAPSAPVAPTPSGQAANAVFAVASADPKAAFQVPAPVKPQQQPVQAPQPAQAQPAPPPVVVQPVAVQQPPQPAPAVQSLAPQRVQSQRILSPDELDRLIGRGEAFLEQGDVAAARLVLQRAAEGRSARAALALGSTYDPNVLRKMGAVGVQPDPDQARSWYERAAEFGSGEATQRLTALAQLTR